MRMASLGCWNQDRVKKNAILIVLWCVLGTSNTFPTKSEMKCADTRQGTVANLCSFRSYISQVIIIYKTSCYFVNVAEVRAQKPSKSEQITKVKHNHKNQVC